MYEEFFKRYQGVDPVDRDLWNEAASGMKLKNLTKGEIFLRPGDSSSTFAIILDGVGRHFYVGDDGKEWTKSFAGPGDLLGAYAEMLQKLDSRTFIEALTPMKVLQGGKLQLDLMSKPEWSSLWRKLAEEHFIKKENREYEFLKYDAAKRYESYLSYYSHLDQFIPRKYVATYLGITPQALSRLNKSDN
tara:strand:+ start:773 stop:1339 length:567 start_codon:yes stop_codon:yes gene_type:complete